MAISITALSSFAGVPDYRTCDRAGGTTNNSTLCRVACNSSANSGSAQTADCGALFRARTCHKRDEQT
jgi:hypothetical protein